MPAQPTHSNPRTKVVARVTTLRERLGMSSRELAERAGMTPAQLSRIVNGKQGFRFATLISIADALGVEPAYLFVDATDSKAARTVAKAVSATSKMGKAMRSGDFAAFTDQLADAYLHRRKAYAAIRAAARAILDGE